MKTVPVSQFSSLAMRGSAESLNVSVATGVVLFELLRQAPKSA